MYRLVSQTHQVHLDATFLWVIESIVFKPLALEIAAELTDIVLRAREGALTTRDVTGGTFTVSNLGMFGIDRFTAIINPPESAILAVGRTVSRPSALNAEGDIGLVPTLTLTLSVDHRVLDGVVAARFLQDLRGAIEEPGWLSY